jgi:hypothetical protein
VSAWLTGARRASRFSFLSQQRTLRGHAGMSEKGSKAELTHWAREHLL